MEIIRKSIKAYLAAVLLFFLLTGVIALLICYTALKESLGCIGIYFIVILSVMFFCFIEGKILKKRGVLTGIVSSLVYTVSIIVLINTCFNNGNPIQTDSVFLILTIIFGIAASILGVNNGK